MPRPSYDINDETGDVSREQTGNMPGDPGYSGTGGGTAPTNDTSGPGWPGPSNPRTTRVAPDVHNAVGAAPSWLDFYRQQMNGFPQFSNPYSSINSEQARAEQQRVIQDLQRSAAGDMNSLAQQQLRQGYGAAQAQQSSLGSTMRGQSAGAAMRGVQQGQQGIQRGLAGDQQMLKLQEQQAAQALLAQMLAQQHQQDIMQAQGSAQGALGAQGLNQGMQQFYTSGLIGQMLGNYQYGADMGRANLGFDLESQSVLDQNRRDALNALATAGTTAAQAFGGGGSGGDFTGPVPKWEDPVDTNWSPFPGGK